MKTKQANKLLVLIISVMMIATLFVGMSVTASAADTGAETTTLAAKISGKQVNLGGDISMKYYVTINDSSVTPDQLKLVVTFLGTQTELTSYSTDTETGEYIFTFDSIPPQCMGDDIDAELYIGENTEPTDSVLDYSVADNLVSTFNNSSDSNLKQLILDTLEYGAAAQIYRGYKTDDLVSAPLIELIASDIDVEPPQSSPVVNETVTGSIGKASVHFSTVNYIKITYINSGTDEGMSSATIAAYDFAKKMQFSVENKFTLEYSINDYCYDAYTDTATSAEMKALAQALYNYGLSAHIVKGNHEGGTATCAEQAVCTICGNGYGEKLEHVYQYEDRGHSIEETCANGCDHSGLLSITVPGGDDAVYTGNPIPVEVDTLNFNASYTLTYDTYDQTAPTNVDSWSFTLTVKDVTITGSYDITAVTPTVTAPTANTLTYTGEAQQLVSAGSADFGTMMYRLGADGEFATTIPEETNAGTYTVYYYAKGDGININDSAVESVTVNIAKANPTFAAPTANTLTYNGEAQELVSAGYAVGGTMMYSLTEDGEFTTTIPNATNADTYTVYYYVKGDANYSDSTVSSVSVTISPITITADMITLKKAVYNGEVQTPNGDHVTVIVNGKTLVHNIDYYIGVPADVEFINAKTYSITVVGQGNYTGSVAMTFTIEQATPTYTAPTGLTAIYGQTLADVELPEGWEWQDDLTTEVGYVGERTFKATYTPTDTNYKAVTDIEVTITVVQDPDTTEFDGEWVTIPTNTEE